MIRRRLWLLLGLATTAMGIAGTVLPLVPTTPFLLVASFAFARSSPRLHGWLTEHPRMGPFLENWRLHGQIERRVKAAAMVAIVAAFVITWLLGFGPTVLVAQAVVLTAVSTFILTRPSGQASAETLRERQEQLTRSGRQIRTSSTAPS